MHPQTDPANKTKVDLAWLREQFLDPEIDPILLQYTPFLLLLCLQDLPRLTPADHCEACEVAFTLFSTSVQGLIAERFINTYVKAGLEAPAMVEQFKVLRQRMLTYRQKAAAFVDRLLEMPNKGDTVN